MSLLKIQVLGSSILRVETTPVAEITDELQLLIDDMFETMHAAQGIGLAAPQVGRSERLAVIEIEGEQYVIINPEIVEESGSAKDEEGCLSIPEIYGEVERSTQVVVHAMDRHGKHFEMAADDVGTQHPDGRQRENKVTDGAAANDEDPGTRSHRRKSVQFSV